MCYKAIFRSLTLVTVLCFCALPSPASGGSASVAVKAAKTKRRLIKAISVRSEKATMAAVKDLISCGGPGAKALLSVLVRLPREGVRSYWLILDGMAAFKDPEAYSVIGDAILRYRRFPRGHDLLLAMQGCRSRFVIRVVRRIMEKGSLRMKLSALDIAARIPVRRTVDVLIDALEREVSRSRGDLRFRIIEVLKSLTGKNFGEAIANWRGWWEKNRSKGLKLIKREGRYTRTVVDHLDPIREKRLTGVEERPEGWALVITASEDEIAFDRIERVLKRMGIPHRVVTKEEFSKANFSLAGVRIICVNCMMWREYCRNPDHRPDNTRVAPRLRRCRGPGAHIMRGYAFSQAAVRKLKAFVERGGYLFTEDMVLEELLSKAWGEYVDAGEFLEEGIVEVRPGRGAGAHPYLRGVFTPAGRMDHDPFAREKMPGEYDIPESEEDNEEQAGPRTRVREKPGPLPAEKIEIRPLRRHWKIDADSPGIRITNSKRVKVLLASDGVKEGGSRAVALTFRPRRRLAGAVLHVLSHFGKQRSKGDEFALQNLLVNFILEAHARHPPKGERR